VCSNHGIPDLSKIKISPDYRVSVSFDIRSTVYEEFHKRTLTLPKSEKEWPNFSKGVKAGNGA
jgi:hypothetical protein